MGFYFRKSIGAGPFRINFSKTGISHSFGVKGARINFSNRGTYVNLGSHGIYYKKKISGTNPTSSKTKPNPSYVPTTFEQHTITSGNVDEITDVDSTDFINELTEKANKISYFNLFGITPLILSIAIALYFFLTVDINLPLFYFVTVSIAVFFFILLRYLKKIDSRRLLVEVYYEIEEDINNVYKKFIYHFSEILNCSRVWQYLHSQKTNDYKYTSGAANTITRKRLTKISTNKGM